MSETTDEKLLGSFRKLIDRCAASADYKPPNPLHAIPVLEAQYAAAMASVHDLDVKLAPYRVKVNDRQIAYDAVPKLFRRSRNNLKSSGASAEFIADAGGLINKIVGNVKSSKNGEKPETPEGEAAKTHSTSQLSYESILGNIRAYNEMVKNEPLYKPNEADLKTTNLDAVADDLEAKNNAVSLAFVPQGQARNLRDTLLYNDKNNVVDTCLGVKSYAAGLGTDHPLYKSIKGLKFPRQKKK